MRVRRSSKNTHPKVPLSKDPSSLKLSEGDLVELAVLSNETGQLAKTVENAEGGKRSSRVDSESSKSKDSRALPSRSKSASASQKGGSLPDLQDLQASNRYSADSNGMNEEFILSRNKSSKSTQSKAGLLLLRSGTLPARSKSGPSSVSASATSSEKRKSLSDLRHLRASYRNSNPRVEKSTTLPPRSKSNQHVEKSTTLPPRSKSASSTSEKRRSASDLRDLRASCRNCNSIGIPFGSSKSEEFTVSRKQSNLEDMGSSGGPPLQRSATLPARSKSASSAVEKRRSLSRLFQRSWSSKKNLADKEETSVEESSSQELSFPSMKDERRSKRDVKGRGERSTNNVKPQLDTISLLAMLESTDAGRAAEAARIWQQLKSKQPEPLGKQETNATTAA